MAIQPTASDPVTDVMDVRLMTILLDEVLFMLAISSAEYGAEGVADAETIVNGNVIGKLIVVVVPTEHSVHPH